MSLRYILLFAACCVIHLVMSALLDYGEHIEDVISSVRGDEKYHALQMPSLSDLQGDFGKAETYVQKVISPSYYFFRTVEDLDKKKPSDSFVFGAFFYTILPNYLIAGRVCKQAYIPFFAEHVLLLFVAVAALFCLISFVSVVVARRLFALLPYTGSGEDTPKAAIDYDEYGITGQTATNNFIISVRSSYLMEYKKQIENGCYLCKHIWFACFAIMILLLAAITY